MPEVDFYFSEGDFVALSEVIFAGGMVAVPDCDYPTSQYSMIKSLKSFLTAAKSCHQFFLLHEAYNSCPLDMRETVGNNGKRFYYIMPRNGGPTIHVYWAGADEHRIRRGFLSHYPTYWNTTEEANLKAPKTLSQEYRKFAAFIKKNSEKLSRPKRSVYLGSDARHLRDLGAILVGWDDVR